MPIAVHWQATHEEDRDFAEPITERQTSLVPEFSPEDPDNGLKLVQHACVEHFKDLSWDHWSGDETGGSMLVRVFEPASLAGYFLVQLEREPANNGPRATTAEVDWIDRTP